MFASVFLFGYIHSVTTYMMKSEWTKRTNERYKNGKALNEFTVHRSSVAHLNTQSEKWDISEIGNAEKTDLLNLNNYLR